MIGFVKWHKMHFEQAVLYWLHTLLCPKQLVFRGANVYDSEIQALRKARIAARKEKKVDLPKDNHSGKKPPKGLLRIPRRTQDMIPVKRVYEDGVFEERRGIFPSLSFCSI